MHMVVGMWRAEGQLRPQDLEHISATVKEQAGFGRGYWGQSAEDLSLAHAVVVFTTAAAAASFAEGVREAIPSAELSVVEVLAEA